MAIFAEPLNLVLIAKRAKTGKFGDAGIEPAKRIGKLQRKQRLEFIAVAKRDKAGLRADALIEREDQGAIEAGGVVGAGRVTEMMIEVGGSGAVAKKLMKELLRSGADMALATRARGRRNAIGKPDGTDFREFQMVFKEAAVERETRDFRGVLQASELFLFDGKEDAAVIQKGDGGTAA